jgi:hypothetical protein
MLFSQQGTADAGAGIGGGVMRDASLGFNDLQIPSRSSHGAVARLCTYTMACCRPHAQIR